MTGKVTLTVEMVITPTEEELRQAQENWDNFHAGPELEPDTEWLLEEVATIRLEEVTGVEYTTVTATSEELAQLPMREGSA